MKNLTNKENFLLMLLKKVIQEYRSLREHVQNIKPYKIIEITKLSSIPGETEFLVQIFGKNCALKLSAADIFKQGLDLSLFQEFHAALIREALQGTILNYLNSRTQKSINRIVSKHYEKQNSEFVYTIENQDGTLLLKTASEIAKDRELLSSLKYQDVYDIGFTNGSETIIEEQAALKLAKRERTLS